VIEILQNKKRALSFSQKGIEFISKNYNQRKSQEILSVLSFSEGVET